MAYIGTTKKGVARLAQSAAAKAETLLVEHGIKEFDVRVITCTPRPGVKTWHKLERALLLQFRELYGEIPLYNSQGHGIKERDEFDYFARSRVRRIVLQLA